VRSIFRQPIKPILLIAVSLCASFFLGCGKSSKTGETPIASKPPETNSPMPPAKTANAEMGWTVANAHHVRLSDSRDNVIVLDFYATWCEPCRNSIPHLIDLQKRYGPKGLQIVGLNVGGPDDYEKVPLFAREFQIPYQLGIPDSDLEEYISDQDAIPQTLVIDRNGVIVERFVGYSDSMAEKLENAIRDSLESKK